MRIVHEAGLHEDRNGSSFVTLTYRDKEIATAEQREKGLHIRDDWSLDSPNLHPPKSGRSHFQRFMKRLRKSRPGDGIKFYQCGEYGNKCKHGINLDLVGCPMCNCGRPHHHAILFNTWFQDLEPYAVQNGITRYTSPELERLWGCGFVDVGKVTFESAAYCARYIMKKVTGKEDKVSAHYTSIDIDGVMTQIEPEYSSMSNGIGKEWYQRYKDDFFPSDEVPLPGTGVIKKVPRYYEEMLKVEDEATHQEVKRKRMEFREENDHEYTRERLMDKYKVKQAQVGMLKRNLDENHYL